MSSAMNSHPLTFLLPRESSYFLGSCSMVRGCEPERSDLARVGARACDLPGGLLNGAGAAYRRHVPLSRRRRRTTFSHSQTLIRGTLSLRSDPRALRSHSHPSCPFLGLPADRSPFDRRSVECPDGLGRVDAARPAGHIKDCSAVRAFQAYRTCPPWKSASVAGNYFSSISRTLARDEVIQ